MMYQNDKFNTDLLRFYIKKANLKIGKFYNELWGSDSHNTLKYFEDKNITLRLAIKVCNILNIRLDDLLLSPNLDGNTPYINGNGNIQNSTVINNDIAALSSENKSLKDQIKMLKKQNSELSRKLDRLIEMVRVPDDKK